MLVHCLHCHEPIELGDEGDLSKVHCPTCGGSFSLVAESTAPYAGPEARTLGHFELIEEVGAGAFGSVWKACDKRLDRIVAVKVPRKGRLEADEAEMFLREARAAAQLRHPNIVAVHEVGREGDTVYIVSDFIQGATLDQWLTGRRLSPREAAELCLQIAEALEYAHRAGVVHRDLKPGNIMLDLSGRPHLLDFGLARRVGREATMTVGGRVLGTPAYMSPEQARGEAHTADHRTDLYSLGVVLFRLLTGELPFRGNAQMLIVQILQDEPPSPRKLNGHVPRDLETICLKCLEKEPEKRYLTAHALAEDLRRFLAGEPITSRPITRVARAWRWCKRNRVVAALTVAVVLLLLSGITVSSYLAYEAIVAEQRLDAESKEVKRLLDQTDRQRGDLSRLVDEQLRRLYAADMLQAGGAWDAGDLTTVESLLRKHLPVANGEDYRSFEWFYLWHLWKQISDSKVVECDSNRMAISPDGKRIVVAGRYGEITPIEIQDGKWKKGKSFGGECEWRMYVAISPDGKTLAHLSQDRKSVVLRDLDTMQEKKPPIPVGTVVNVVAFSPNAPMLAIACDKGTILIWDLDRFQERGRRQPDSNPVWALEFSPDGKRLISGGAGGILRGWDAIAMKIEWELAGHAGMINDVTFSHDGKWFATASSDRTVVVWDAVTRERVRTLIGARDEMRVVEFSADGRAIAAASRDGLIRVWGLPEFRELGTISGFSCRFDMGFLPDGRLAYGTQSRWIGISKPGALAQASFIDCGRTRAEEFGGVPTQELAYWPGGKIVAATSKDGLRLWRTVEGSYAALDLNSVGFQGPWIDPCIDISNDGLLAAGDFGSGRVQVADLVKRRKMLDLPAPGQLKARTVAFSPTGRRLAIGYTGDSQGTVLVVDVAEGTKLFDRVVDPMPGRKCLCFCGDDKRLLIGASLAELWDIEEGSRLAPFGERAGVVQRACASRDGTRIGFLRDGFGDVEVWNTVSGSRTAVLTHHAIRTIGFEFYGDDKTLISVGGPRELLVWDLANFERRLAVDLGAVIPTCMAISRDRSLIAVAGRDGTIRLYRAATKAEVKAAGW